jgi:hypothetical protein
MDMSDNNVITKDRFLKRIGDLCLKSGLSGFPKDEADQHILLKSVVLVIGPGEALPEKEINEKLQLWNLITRSKGLDHSTLRRRLVDAGYLERSKDGSAYRVRPAGPGKFEFEAAIEQIDLAEALDAARAEIERRKQEYLAKSRQG